jgi:uncharacterized protein (TIGR00159 family)
MKGAAMSRFNNEMMSTEEKAIKEKLEDLNFQVNDLNTDLPCLRQCSQLSHLLQKMCEIREGLNRLEQGLLKSHLKCCISQTTKIPGEVVNAISNLSKKRHGAIIVIEQEDKLNDYIKGGMPIEAAIRSPILENIFYPGSPLHDGAVLIRDAHIEKANCMLPMAPHDSELDALGLATRHRAALGLSQISDALVIVVSEEKGWISIALKGQFYPNLGTFALLEKLGSDK